MGNEVKNCIVIGVIVDDSEVVKANRDPNRTYDCYRIIGVKLLDLYKNYVENVSLTEFFENENRIYHNLEYLVDNRKIEVAVDSSNFKRFAILNGFNENIRLNINCYDAFMFNTNDAHLGTKDNRIIHLGYAYLENLGCLYIYYNFESCELVVSCDNLGNFLDKSGVHTLSDEFRNDISKGRTEVSLKEFAYSLVENLGTFSKLFDNLYFINEPSNSILLPTDCRYFISRLSDFNGVQNIVIPPSCEIVIIDPVYTVVNDCSILISKNNSIDKSKSNIKELEKMGFKIEYY